MLACQLCALDDKTDSKSKWVKKIIAWLCCPDYLSSLFCKDSDAWWFAAIMTMHAKWMYPPFLKELEKWKLLPCTKGGNADKNITKKTRSSVECWDHCD